MRKSTHSLFKIILFMSSIFVSISFCQSSDSFVSSNFEIPESFVTDKFRLRMLTVNDVIKDYDAVMTSVDHLKGVFGPNSTWPSKDLTIEQDLIDLGWHQKEFQRRTSFAYTVMNLDESLCLGCVYIDPTRKKEYDDTKGKGHSSEQIEHHLGVYLDEKAEECHDNTKHHYPRCSPRQETKACLQPPPERRAHCYNGAHEGVAEAETDQGSA